MSATVTTVASLANDALSTLFASHGIEVRGVSNGSDIPWSYWGAPEAGICENTLWVRADTPVHSALHEGGHLVCMGSTRRAIANRDAGGDDDEECAVCYLSILMAGVLPGYDRERMLSDMDAWGYSFRLGNAARWFEHDAGDARQWLIDRGFVVAGPQQGMERLT